MPPNLNGLTMPISIREQFEKREDAFMSPFACPSSTSKGRSMAEAPCAVRTAFQVDRDRIVYSNAFRRLKHKTQVFLAPLVDDYRTRLTHTLEVAQIARAIARALYLNEDLTEAIALGHDLGHTPFGHSGEAVLKEIYANGFSHAEQSLRVVEVLENSGHGLNLTREVLDGILKHSKGYGRILPEDPEELAATFEGRVVRIADFMAYLNHDLDDAIRSGIVVAAQVPGSCTRRLGATHSERATTMIKDLISTSRPEAGTLRLALSNGVHAAMLELRQFLYENVYRSEQVHRDFEKSKKILSELFAVFLENDALLRRGLADLQMEGCIADGQPRERLVCDFIASMTDRYAMNLYTRLFFPSPFLEKIN
jgi:dGTPase